MGDSAVVSPYVTRNNKIDINTCIFRARYNFQTSQQTETPDTFVMSFNCLNTTKFSALVSFLYFNSLSSELEKISVFLNSMTPATIPNIK